MPKGRSFGARINDVFLPMAIFSPGFNYIRVNKISVYVFIMPIFCLHDVNDMEQKKIKFTMLISKCAMIFGFKTIFLFRIIRLQGG